MLNLLVIFYETETIVVALDFFAIVPGFAFSVVCLLGEEWLRLSVCDVVGCLRVIRVFFLNGLYWRF